MLLHFAPHSDRLLSIGAVECSPNTLLAFIKRDFLEKKNLKRFFPFQFRELLRVVYKKSPRRHTFGSNKKLNVLQSEIFLSIDARGCLLNKIHIKSKTSRETLCEWQKTGKETK